MKARAQPLRCQKGSTDCGEINRTLLQVSSQTKVPTKDRPRCSQMTAEVYEPCWTGGRVDKTVTGV